jgi:hypothetical protein
VGGGGGGGKRPPPFTISTITYEVVVYTRAERADTLPLFLLYPYMYSVQITINVLLYQGYIRCSYSRQYSVLRIYYFLCEYNILTDENGGESEGISSPWLIPDM